MEEAGWVGLGVIPTFDKFPRALEAGTSKHMAAAGATSGRQFGDAAGKSAGSRFGKVFKTAAKGALIGAGLLGAAAVKFGADSVSAASDIAESTNKLDQVFGKASGRITKFSGKAAAALGQTDLQARNAAATFGIYGKAAKMTEGQNAKFSKRMTRLASDLASFHNTEPEVAIEALGSALRGEAEPMRQFGVLLDDASMRTEAVRLGLIKTTKEALTPQNKVLAAQALIFKQTKDAQGDFSRTSDGLANQQRILKARFEDTKIAVGTALLPAVNDAVRFINDRGIPVLEDFGDWFNRKGVPAIKDFGGFVSGTLVPALADFGDKAGPLAKSVLPEIRDAAADVRDVFKDLAPFVEDAFDAFNNLPDGVKKGIVIAGGALALKKLVGGRNGGNGGSGGVTIAGATKDALKTKAGQFLADKLLAKFAKPLPVFVVNQPGTTEMLGKKGTMGALAKWGVPAAIAGSAAVDAIDVTDSFNRSRRAGDAKTGSKSEILSALQDSNVGKYAADLGVNLDRLATDLDKYGTKGKYATDVQRKLNEQSHGFGNLLMAQAGTIVPGWTAKTQKADRAAQDLERITTKVGASAEKTRQQAERMHGELTRRIKLNVDNTDIRQAIKEIRTLINLQQTAASMDAHVVGGAKAAENRKRYGDSYSFNFNGVDMAGAKREMSHHRRAAAVGGADFE